MRPRRLVDLAAILALASSVACARPTAAPTGWQMGPPDASPGGYWSDAIHLLQLGDPDAARVDMDRAADGGAASSAAEPALFYRDLAEARLFGGDDAGAASAALQARAALDVKPETAQFRAPDRRLFEIDVDALETAARGDADRLAALASADPFSADPWYLLGWLAERRGDPDAASHAYRAYLAHAPQGSFLRQAGPMRQHASSVVGTPSR